MGIKILLREEQFIDYRVAYYVDSLILARPFELAKVDCLYYEFFILAFEKLERKLKRTYGFGFQDVFILKDKYPYNPLTLKVKEIKELNFTKNKMTGKNILTFVRDNQTITYKG